MLVTIAMLLLATPQAAPLQTRCGWLHNPTPGNWWLTDRDGQWVLNTQGGVSAPGWDNVTAGDSPDWVRTNGNYGYGCACARMRVDPKRGRVVEIRSLAARPIKACRADRKLPRP